MTARANERIAYFNGDYVPESGCASRFATAASSSATAPSTPPAPSTAGSSSSRSTSSASTARSSPAHRPRPVAGRDDRVSEEVASATCTSRPGRGPLGRPARLARHQPGRGRQLDHSGPTVIVECMPLPFKARAPALPRRHRRRRALGPPGLARHDQPARQDPQLPEPDPRRPRGRAHPEAWAILLDHNGNLSEGLGTNIFMVQDGRLLTPHERFVLPGVSRETAIELAAAERHRGRGGRHRPLRRLHRRGSLHHLDQLLHLPGAQHQRRDARRGRVPGPITKR